ncbi:MAG: hypothetical protein ACXWHB_01025 [Usitatibacter sp.]
MTNRPILTVEEFYAHAIAIEREAAERYREFEAYFADRGEDVISGLCRSLAQFEGEHLDALLKSSDHLELPAIDASSHQWLEAGSPEAPAREFFYRVANKRQLLEIALRSECNALGFFEWVSHTTPDATVRALARDMAAEEMEHVTWVRNALEYDVPKNAFEPAAS